MNEPSAKVRQGAIILGGHVQALGIVRILGRTGVPVKVVDNTAHCIARRSKFCIGFYIIRDDHLTEFLNDPSFIIQHKGWVVFPTNDLHVRILSINKQKLERSFIISTDNWDIIKLFYNKKETYRLAQKIGIQIAPTFYPGSRTDLHDLKIKYPCIIKPAVMIEFFNKTKKKVFLCRNSDELFKNYDKALYIIPADEIIVQEVIPGPSRNQFSACFLYLNNRSFVSLTACRMRQHPLDFGNATTYAETVDIPLLKKYGEKILRAAQYNGLCEVEFKLDERDNIYKLLEVNPRTWKWHSIANKAETPFLQLFFNYLTGKAIHPVEGFKNASFCHSLTDLPTRLKLLFKGYDYWNRFMSPVENAVWTGNDPLPWFYEKLYIMMYLFRR
jgi:predicted ATP-grasp superfamily ATP-dependent carboligase